MKATCRKTSQAKDPFDLDERGFLIGYRFLGIIFRKSRRITKGTGKKTSAAGSAAKNLGKR